MKMKKVLAVMLAAAMCIGVLAGCGTSAGEEQPAGASDDANSSEEETGSEAADETDGEAVTLRMMVFGSTEVYENINKDFFEINDDLAGKVNIEVELGGSGDFDVAEKIRLALASGEELPDIIRLNYTQLPEFAEAGILEPIDRFVEPYSDNIIDGAKVVMEYNGTMYAFPREIKPKVWYYRTDIFEECGIDPAEIKTVDDFIAAGEKIQEKYPNSHLENYNVPSQQYDLTMYLCATGGRFCDEEGNYNISTDEGTKKAFEMIKKIHDSSVNSTVEEWSADWGPAFASDELVSQLIAGWWRQDMMNWGIEELRGKIGLALWPEEIRYGSDAGGAIWVIPSSSENKELAGDILGRMCFDEETARMIYEKSKILPAIKSAVDDPVYNAEDDYFVGNIAAVNFEAMEYLKVYPYTPASSQEITIVKQYLDEYLTGNMTVEEALKAAEDDLKNQIGNPYQ